VSPGGQTALGTRAGGPTGSPGGQTARKTGAGGPTASPGSPTARPCAAPPSPTSTASRVVPTTSAVAPASTTPVVPPAAPASQLYPLHYSRHPQATREGTPLSNFSIPVLASIVLLANTNYHLLANR
jgi:hypothetical protein